MRFPGRPVLLVLMLAALPCFAAAQSLPSTSAPPVLPDPVPGAGADYAPSAATAGEGYVGPPLRKADPSLACSPANPCAYPSSTPRKLSGIGMSPADN